MWGRRHLLVPGTLAGFVFAAASPAMGQAQAAAPPSEVQEAEVSEVVVAGTKPDVVSLVDRKTYNVQADLQAQGGSAADALRSIPSLSVDVLGNVSMRGNGNVTILVDGKPAARFEGDGRGQALQDLPADQIERVEIATNPSADLAGNGSGGVINLITKKARGLGPSGSARASLGTQHRNAAGATFGFNGPSLSSTADIFYRHDTQRQSIDDQRSAVDAARGAFLQSRRTSAQTAVIETVGAAGSGDLEIDAKTQLSGEVRLQRRALKFGNQQVFVAEPVDGADLDYRRRLDVSQALLEGSVRGGFKRSFDRDGEALTGSVSFQQSRDRRDRIAATTPDIFAPFADLQQVRNRLKRWNGELAYVRPVGETSTLKAGIDLQLDRNLYRTASFRGALGGNLSPVADLTNIFPVRQSLAQGYLTFQAQRSDLTVLAGLRVHNLNIELPAAFPGAPTGRDDLAVLPSLHLTWMAAEGHELSASVSRRQTRPQPEQYNPFPFLLDPVTLRSGNPDLKPQLTDALELGYARRSSGRGYSAAIYAQRTRDLVADVVVDLGDGIFLTRPENISSQRTAGVEMSADGALFRGLGYKLSANAYWSEIDAPEPGGSHSITGVGAKVGLDWRLGPSDRVQINADLTGRRITPQGQAEPFATLAIGYRRDLTPNWSLLLIAQDALGTFRDRQEIATPILRSRLDRDVNARTLLLRLVWTSARRKAPADIDLNVDRQN